MADNYQHALDIERRGVELTTSLLRNEGASVTPITNKEQQLLYGDLQVSGHQFSGYAEVKTEERNPNGNFFVETFSCRNRQYRNPGWLFKSRCDWLVYVFLDEMTARVMDYQRLSDWVTDRVFAGRNFRHTKAKCDQKNDTWGLLVPIAEVASAVGFVEYSLYDESMFACFEN